MNTENELLENELRKLKVENRKQKRTILFLSIYVLLSIFIQLYNMFM
jgi:hypothetical protein